MGVRFDETIYIDLKRNPSSCHSFKLDTEFTYIFTQAIVVFCNFLILLLHYHYSISFV